MKKFVNSFCAVFVLAAGLLVTGCKAPSGGGGSNKVIVNTAVAGSEVFIYGRSVEIYAKWICDHEVTQKEWNDVMGDWSQGIRNYAMGTGTGFNIGDDYPMSCINWYWMIYYCNKRSISEHLKPCYKINGSTDPDDWGSPPSRQNSIWDAVECDFTANGYRLPTETEWEYFARGGAALSEDKYSGTNDDSNLEDFAWYKSNSGDVAHIIKTKNPNSLNLYDMSGNILEACWDWYDTITSQTPSTGPQSGTKKVFRGGCYEVTSDGCSVLHRYGGEFRPGMSLGLRVCRSN